MSSNADLTRPMDGTVDRKSGQLINDEVMITQQGRTRVKDNSRFNVNVADQEMERHLRRKRNPVPVKFLVDRMRFAKRGYHQYLPYRDIQHFYQPDKHPNVFMLYTRDKKGRLSYETYKCLAEQDVEKVRELINQAGHDERKLLNESEYRPISSRRGSWASTSSSEYDLKVRPSGRMSRASSMVSIPVQPATYEEVYYRPVVEKPVVVYETRTSRPVSVEPRYEYRRSQSANNSYIYAPTRRTISPPRVSYAQSRQSYVPIRQSVTPVRQSYYQASRPQTPNNNSFFDEDITYLRSDNVHGTQIMDYGPVYLYVSRSKTNLDQPNHLSGSPTSLYNEYY